LIGGGDISAGWIYLHLQNNLKTSRNGNAGTELASVIIIRKNILQGVTNKTLTTMKLKNIQTYQAKKLNA
jgi:hypothetical protein